MKACTSMRMLIFAALGLMACLLLGIRRMPLMHPSRGLHVTKIAHPTRPYVTKKIENPSYLPGSTIEEITFFSPELHGSTHYLSRKGILVIRPQAKGTILICHGYMCSKYDAAFLRSLFPDYNTFVFDFRAHGEATTNQCSTLGLNEALDVTAAAHCLMQHPKLKNYPLFGYGFSMGAVSLIQAQAAQPLFDGLILDCPFDSSRKVLSHLLGQTQLSFCGYYFDLPGRGLIQKYAFHPYVEPFVRRLVQTTPMTASEEIRTKVSHFKPIQAIAKIITPCFFIHCKNDEKVSLQSAKRLYAKAAGFKRLWITNGRRHFDSYFYNPEQYQHRVQKFLSSIQRKEYAHKPKQKIIIDS